MAGRLLAALRRHRFGADAVLGVAVGVLTGAALQAAGWPSTAAAIFGVSTGLTLLWRRRTPLLALTLTCAGVDVAAAVGSYLSPVAMLGILIAWYSLASQAKRRHAVLAAAVAAGSFAASVLASPRRASRWPEIVLLVSLMACAWLIAEYLRVRRAYVASVEVRAAELEQRRDEERALAAAEERMRIARELHDVVAHHVGVIAIQAGAAKVMHRRESRVGSREPSTESTQRLELIGATARTALVELSRIVGVLRKDGPTELSPQPSLAEAHRLVDAARQAGVEVTFTIDGEARVLPAAVDLSAYRILQEALTNVIKHAGQAHVWVRIHYRSRSVRLSVVNDGQGNGIHEPVSGGHGLVGMRERVALLGGQFHAGPRAEGGFEVDAELVIEEGP